MIETTHLKDLQILVAEDEAINTEILSKILTKHIYPPVSIMYVTSAQDGKKYLDDIHDISILLTDGQMETGNVRDGIELAKHAKSLYPRMPVIMLTGSPEFVNKSYIGVDKIINEVLEKPYDITRLIATIKRLVS